MPEQVWSDVDDIAEVALKLAPAPRNSGVELAMIPPSTVEPPAAHLVEHVMTQPGPTLISWQHSEIPSIVDEFPSVSPDPPEEWPSDRFDVVWTLTRTADGWTFTQTPELVLPQDHAGVIEN